jgi:hypothetical protein
MASLQVDCFFRTGEDSRKYRADSRSSNHTSNVLIAKAEAAAAAAMSE